MLKATNLHKRYGSLEVLKGVDLHVDKAEIVSIVGASGAGKSTLLHILGTLDDVDQGNILINNREINRLNKEQRARFRNEEIGFVFQFHNLLPEFTALENICIPGYIQNGGKWKVVQQKARELMRALGIEARADHKPSQLSGGEQQRVAISRALINDPAIIFADEPSGNLDSKNAEELHQLFFDLRDNFDQTFVIVTHNEELANLADRRLEIKDGLIVGQQELK
ncbi:MAG: ABC transporter ATP-binding protein [Candidatus Cyclobacteriaceae bacterium M2_1C_046]